MTCDLNNGLGYLTAITLFDLYQSRRKYEWLLDNEKE